MQTTFDIDFYSPRLGHADKYSIHFDDKEVNVKLGANTVKCSLEENGNTQWTGYNNSKRNSFLELLRKDSIYAPMIFVEAIEYAWESWKDGRITENDLQKEIELLVEWINISSKNKPKSDFWSIFF